jgi:hypothetical protein
MQSKLKLVKDVLRAIPAFFMMLLDLSQDIYR